MKKPRLLAPAAQQLLLLFEIVAAASDCGDGSATTTITIANSGDASSLASACATIEASVSIGAGAGGDIELDGVQVIRGELQVESCSALGCDEETTTRISSSTLELVDGDVNIANLSGLQNLSFPALGEVKGQFSVHDLDSLDTLNLSALSSVGNLTISNVRQLYYLKLGIAQANKVSVTGNKQLVLQLDGTTTSDDTNSGLVSYLDISRIGELRWGASNGGIVVGNLAVHDTGITELPLLFSSVQSLDVWNNEDLTEVLFPADENAQTRLFSQLKQISIGNNEKFNMTTIRSVEWNSTDMLSWVWPSENLDSVVLDGIIHIAFFQPLIDTHQYTTPKNAESSGSRVVKNFNITSSASTFHCEPIDELRRHGVFPGNYSCNGDHVDIPNSGGIRGGGRSMMIHLMTVAAAGLHVLL